MALRLDLTMIDICGRKKEQQMSLYISEKDKTHKMKKRGKSNLRLQRQTPIYRQTNETQRPIWEIDDQRLCILQQGYIVCCDGGNDKLERKVIFVKNNTPKYVCTRTMYNTIKKVPKKDQFNKRKKISLLLT
jgi:hypothetical protein